MMTRICARTRSKQAEFFAQTGAVGLDFGGSRFEGRVVSQL